MFKRSGTGPTRPAGGARLIDLCVIAAAAVFFINIVIGSPAEDDQMLFLAAEIGAPMLEIPATEQAAAYEG